MRFIETNVFIYVLTAHPEFGAVAKRILSRVENGEESVTSSLVIAEVCAWLQYHSMKSDVKTFLKALESYPSLRKIDTTYVDLLTAQQLEAKHSHLEFFDRVYLAQMARLSIDEIYSNDKGFDKIRGIKRIFN